MTRDEINTIADEAAKKAVREILLALGIDASNPHSIIEAQADHKFVRDWRESTEAVKSKAIRTAVGIVISGLVGYFVLFFKWPTH